MILQFLPWPQGWIHFVENIESDGVIIDEYIIALEELKGKIIKRII